MPALQPQLTKQVPVPAPAGGVNAVSAATEMAPTDALMLVNMIGGRLGVTSRLGYQAHVTGLGAEARTIIPFTGGAATADKLFAVTPVGIYDATAGAPSLAQAFTYNDDDAGWGVFTSYVTLGGHFSLYADERNGLFRYNGTAWAPVTDITFPDGTTAADIVFVTTWKNRIWMVKRGTGNAYFLDVGVVAGTARRHSFGNKFRAGGYLVGLWSWTRDGGAGVDDFLVAVSSAGDVLVYQGSDPAVVGAFELTGDWNVGAVPAGRRIASDFGGDLLVLSKLGVVNMAKLITGTLGEDQYTTVKIQPLFNKYTSERGAVRGWSLRLHPEDNAVVVNMPLLGGQQYEQFALSLATGGWSLLTGIPSVSSEVWHGRLYFGTPDGRVCVATGGNDEGRPVEWSGQTSFQTAGLTQRKRVHQIQPLVTSEGARPGFEVAARYDFDTSAITANAASPDTSSLPKWGLAVWNLSRWGGSTRGVAGSLSTLSPWRGASGTGYWVSLAFKGRSSGRTTLLGFNVRFDTGGIR